MRQAPALLLLSLLAVSCGGGGGGNGGGPSLPTEPRPSLRISAVVIAPTNGGAQEIILSFDGREVDRHTPTDIEFGCATGCSLEAQVNEVSTGAHTLTVTIARQSRNVITYNVLGGVAVASGTSPRNIDLPRREVSLRAGESVSYSITV